MATLKSSFADNEGFKSLLANFSRSDGRKDDQSRPIKITANFTRHAEGSVLIETGETKIICTASVEKALPSWMRSQQEKGGWLTAEYGMLPRSTGTRKKRESTQGKVEGRTQEIQRLIGRSLRSVVDMSMFPERTVWIDCDVIQADGGTRTAAITGGFVAMVLAFRKLYEDKEIRKSPVLSYVTATSIGVVHGRPMLDLKYDEDSSAEVDMNVVMLDNGKIIEVQGTAEKQPFSRDMLNTMLDLAEKGMKQNFQVQKEALQGYLVIRD